MKHFLLKTACAATLVLPALAAAAPASPGAIRIAPSKGSATQVQILQASVSHDSETYAMIGAGLMMMATIARRRRGGRKH